MSGGNTDYDIKNMIYMCIAWKIVIIYHWDTLYCHILSLAWTTQGLFHHLHISHQTTEYAYIEFSQWFIIDYLITLTTPYFSFFKLILNAYSLEKVPF